MYCNHCGQQNPIDSKFCKSCGKDISTHSEINMPQNKQEGMVEHAVINNNNPTNKKPVINIQINEEDKVKLQKIYKNTGDSSIALSIIGFIAFILLTLNIPENSQYGLAILVVSCLIHAPFFHFGRKLKKIGTSNLQYSLKVSRGMLIYGIISTITYLLFGIYGGFLWFLLLYYYYKSYRATKKLLYNTK